MPTLKRMSQAMHSRKKQSAMQTLRTGDENIASAEFMPSVPVAGQSSLSVSVMNEQDPGKNDLGTKSKHTHTDPIQRYFFYQQRKHEEKQHIKHRLTWQNKSTKNTHPGHIEPHGIHTGIEHVSNVENESEECKKKRKCLLMRIRRSREEYRSLENKKRNISRNNTRNSEEYKTRENEIRNLSRKQKRSQDEYKTQENRIRNVSRKRKRSQDEYKTQENRKRNVSRKRKRSQDEYKPQENRIRNVSRKRKRSQDEYKTQENRIRNVSRKRKRSQDEYKAQENRKRNVSRKRKRAEDNHRTQENEMRNTTRRNKRTDTSYRKKTERGTHQEVNWEKILTIEKGKSSCSTSDTHRTYIDIPCPSESRTCLCLLMLWPVMVPPQWYLCD